MKHFHGFHLVASQTTEFISNGDIGTKIIKAIDITSLPKKGLPRRCAEVVPTLARGNSIGAPMIFPLHFNDTPTNNAGNKAISLSLYLVDQ